MEIVIVTVWIIVDNYVHGIRLYGEKKKELSFSERVFSSFLWSKPNDCLKL